MNEKIGWFFVFLVVLALIISIMSAILMATWNYAIPRLVHSVDKSYDVDKDFASIDFWTALVALFFVSIVFMRGGSGDVYIIKSAMSPSSLPKSPTTPTK